MRDDENLGGNTDDNLTGDNSENQNSGETPSQQGDTPFNEQDSPYSAASELPASVIFMEMMRQAAAKRTPTDPQAPRPPRPRPNRITAPPSKATLTDPAPSSDMPTPSPAAPLEPAAVESPPEPIQTAHTPTSDDEAIGAGIAAFDTVESPILPPDVSPATPIEPDKPNNSDDKKTGNADKNTGSAHNDPEDDKLEAQRIRRVKRRQEKRRVHRVSILGGILRALIVIIPSALLMATILSWWTDPQFLKPEVRENLQAAILADGATPIPPTITPTPNWGRQIGIVAGHSGPGLNGLPDPGAVCPDGLTELELNNAVAIQVVIGLRERGYIVDLLEEFDPRLQNYQSAALVSIHANSCMDYGEYVSGYLVAKAEARPEGGIDTRLAECIAKYYGNRSGLDRHFGLTRDMTDYHTFREIHPTTPAAIIELGFMLADREIMTERPDTLALGIIEGILCFIEPEFDILPAPVTATPTLPPP